MEVYGEGVQAMRALHGGKASMNPPEPLDANSLSEFLQGQGLIPYIDVKSGVVGVQIPGHKAIKRVTAVYHLIKYRCSYLGNDLPLYERKADLFFVEREGEKEDGIAKGQNYGSN